MHGITVAREEDVSVIHTRPSAVFHRPPPGAIKPGRREEPRPLADTKYIPGYGESGPPTPRNATLRDSPDRAELAYPFHPEKSSHLAEPISSGVMGEGWMIEVSRQNVLLRSFNDVIFQRLFWIKFNYL